MEQKKDLKQLEEKLIQSSDYINVLEKLKDWFPQNYDLVEIEN